MRSAILVSLLLGVGRPVLAAPVRVVVVHDAELLPSEGKALADLERRLKQKLGAVAFAEASATERTAARDLLDAKTGAQLDPSWQAGETVVVLEVLPPSGEKPKRLSRGVGGLLVLRPPAQMPVFAERPSGSTEVSLQAEPLAAWLTRAIALAAQVAP